MTSVACAKCKLPVWSAAQFESDISEHQAYRGVLSNKNGTVQSSMLFFGCNRAKSVHKAAEVTLMARGLDHMPRFDDRIANFATTSQCLWIDKRLRSRDTQSIGSSLKLWDHAKPVPPWKLRKARCSNPECDPPHGAGLGTVIETDTDEWRCLRGLILRSMRNGGAHDTTSFEQLTRSDDRDWDLTVGSWL